MTAVQARQHTRTRARPRRIPPNFFAIGFGLTGLGEAWQVTGQAGHTPTAATTVIFSLAGATWFAVLTAYLAGALVDRDTAAHDLNDHAAAPFLSLALITPMLISAQLLYPHDHPAGTIAVDVFLVLTLTLGGWFTGQWIYTPLSIDELHPGYFLPTVAGGLLAATSAATVGQQRLAETMFGLGLICWLVLGSIVLNRLLTRPLPPDALLPTIAVEMAPPAVASLAWFALHGVRIDTVAEFLGGYGLLMVLAQLRLLPAYLRLRFRASAWAFTFSWTAVATTALVWLQSLQPAGYEAWETTSLAAVTLLVGGISLRTLLALTRHELLPRLTLNEHHPDTRSTTPREGTL